MKKSILFTFLWVIFCISPLNNSGVVWAKGKPSGKSNPADQSSGNDGSGGGGDVADGSQDGSQDPGDNGGDSGGVDGADGNSGNDGNDNGGDTSSDGSSDASGGNSATPPKWDDSAMSSSKLAPPPPQEAVECFGIMGAGQNDNVFVDVDGRQYGYGEAPACHPLASIKLPKDSLYMCENITVGRTEKGELIRGSLKPDPDRRSPIVCYPYDFIKQKITYMNPDYAVPLRGFN